MKIIVKHELPIKPFGYPDIYLAYLIKKNYLDKNLKLVKRGVKKKPREAQLVEKIVSTTEGSSYAPIVDKTIKDLLERKTKEERREKPRSPNVEMEKKKSQKEETANLSDVIQKAGTDRIEDVWKEWQRASAILSSFEKERKTAKKEEVAQKLEERPSEEEAVSKIKVVRGSDKELEEESQETITSPSHEVQREAIQKAEEKATTLPVSSVTQQKGMLGNIMLKLGSLKASVLIPSTLIFLLTTQIAYYNQKIFTSISNLLPPNLKLWTIFLGLAISCMILTVLPTLTTWVIRFWRR